MSAGQFDRGVAFIVGAAAAELVLLASPFSVMFPGVATLGLVFPMLAGQYTSYLKRQMEKYVKGERPHDEEGIGGLLNKLKEEDMQDILAYITTLQEQQ